MTKIRFACVCLLFALALGGCGSSSKSSSGSSGGSAKQLSKSEYKQKLDALSAQFKVKGAAANARLRAATGLTAKLGGLDELRGLLSQFADQIDALKPPGDLKSSQDGLTTAVRKEASDVKRIEAVARTNDKAKIQAALALVQTDNSDSKAKRLALTAKANSK